MDAANTNPRVVIVAGPNGSGKSTLIRQLRLDRHVAFPEHYINADDIAAHLREVLPEMSQVERERDAFRRARSLRLQYRAEGVSHAFETVFSHPSTLIDMQLLQSAGFHVVFYFVTTERPEINIERVAHRVQEGGHDVPVDRIRDRYYRAMGFLPRAVEIANESYIFDSSHTREAGTRLVAAFEKGVVKRTENLPAFLIRALLDPIDEREEERARLKENLSNRETYIQPQEDAGIYSGIIKAVLQHYAVQQVGPTTFLSHDMHLLTAAVTEGEDVTITYKDGYGTLQAN